jgi:hypothetical protein
MAAALQAKSQCRERSRADVVRLPYAVAPKKIVNDRLSLAGYFPQGARYGHGARRHSKRNSDIRFSNQE